MSAVMNTADFTDFKVADISLADWGRREIIIAIVSGHSKKTKDSVTSSNELF